MSLLSGLKRLGNSRRSLSIVAKSRLRFPRIQYRSLGTFGSLLLDSSNVHDVQQPILGLVATSAIQGNVPKSLIASMNVSLRRLWYTMQSMFRMLFRCLYLSYNFSSALLTLPIAYLQGIDIVD